VIGSYFLFLGRPISCLINSWKNLSLMKEGESCETIGRGTATSTDFWESHRLDLSGSPSMNKGSWVGEGIKMQFLPRSAFFLFWHNSKKLEKRPWFEIRSKKRNWSKKGKKDCSRKKNKGCNSPIPTGKATLSTPASKTVGLEDFPAYDTGGRTLFPPPSRIVGLVHSTNPRSGHWLPISDFWNSVYYIEYSS